MKSLRSLTHAWKAGGNCQCASVILGFFNGLPQHLLYWNNTNVYLFRSCLFRFRLPQILNSSRESSSCTELLLLSLLVLPQPNFVRSLTAGKNVDLEWRLTCLLPNETPFLSPIARGHLALLWVLPSSIPTVLCPHQEPLLSAPNSSAALACYCKDTV